MPDLSEIDDFINNASDQAAAWYSIVTDKPVVVPSATIQAQQNVVNQQPIAGVVNTPIGSYIGGSPFTIDLLVLAVAAVAVFVLIQK